MLLFSPFWAAPSWHLFRARPDTFSNAAQTHKLHNKVRTSKANSKGSCQKYLQNYKLWKKLLYLVSRYSQSGVDQFIIQNQHCSASLVQPELFLKTSIRVLLVSVVLSFVLQWRSVCRSCFTASGISVFLLIEN